MKLTIILISLLSLSTLFMGSQDMVIPIPFEQIQTDTTEIVFDTISNNIAIDTSLNEIHIKYLNSSIQLTRCKVLMLKNKMAIDEFIKDEDITSK